MMNTVVVKREIINDDYCGFHSSNLEDIEDFVARIIKTMNKLEKMGMKATVSMSDHHAIIVYSKKGE